MEAFGGSSFTALAGLLLISRIGPYLVQLLLSAGICAIGLRGVGRGWRLIAGAGGLATLCQLLYAYPLYVMTLGQASASDLGQTMLAYNVISSVLRPIEGALLIYGLVTLQRDPGTRGSRST